MGTFSLLLMNAIVIGVAAYVAYLAVKSTKHRHKH